MTPLRVAKLFGASCGSGKGVTIMSDPKRINEDLALVLAMMEINRILVGQREERRQGPAPEVVAA